MAKFSLSSRGLEFNADVELKIYFPENDNIPSSQCHFTV